MRVLRSRLLLALGVLAPATAAALTACRAPTEVTVELWTDSCDAGYRGTTVSAVSTETLAAGQGANIPPAVQTGQTCGADGGIGTLVVVPGVTGEGPFIVTVITGIDKTDPGNCGAGTNVGCIIERRELSFIDHQPILLPIDMYGACAGVVCGDGGTCLPSTTCTDGGACVSKGECTSDNARSLCTGGTCTVTLNPDAATTKPLDTPDAGHDAGHDTAHDAGHDSGRDDGGKPVDSGVDATLIDSGHDAGHDGPKDATIHPIDSASDVQPIKDASPLSICAQDGGCLTRIAAGLPYPWAIAVHGSRVYWTTLCFTEEGVCPNDGGVFSAPTTLPSAATPDQLAGHQDQPFAIVADDAGVFWTTTGECSAAAGLSGSCTGTVMQMGFDGGGKTLRAGAPDGSIAVSQVRPLGLAARGDTLYWVDNGLITPAPDSGSVRSTDNALVALVAHQPYPGGIAVDDQHLFWTNFGPTPGSPTGTLMRSTLTGADAAALASAQSYITNVTLADASVFWIDQGENVAGDDHGVIYSTSQTAHSPANAIPVASGISPAYGIAVDDTSVYWADPVLGNILRVPRTGGTVVTLAQGLPSPSNVVIDDGTLYWTNNGTCTTAGCTGSVMRLTLPGHVIP